MLEKTLRLNNRHIQQFTTLYSEELSGLQVYRSTSTLEILSSWRNRWAGHLAHMVKTRIARTEPHYVATISQHKQNSAHAFIGTLSVANFEENLVLLLE